MKIFKNIFIATVKELIRDRGAIFWFLAFPIIFVFIFGMVFSGGGEQSFNIGIILEAENPVTEQLVGAISSIPNFNVSVEKEDRDVEFEALRKGNRSLVFVIPDLDYRQLMAGNEGVEIPIYYDAGKKHTNQVLISVVQQVFSEIERGITGQPKFFNLAPEPVQAERISDFDYILPGILAMAIMQLGLFGSIQFLSLREKKIIRGLGVTPLPQSTILGSEILVRLIMSLIQAFLVLSIGRLVFGVTILGSLFSVAGIVLLGALTFIALGYMLISFVKTLEAGQGLVQAVQFPMMFLSGIFFPVEMMPDYIKPVVKAMPLTYLGDALRQIMVGAGSYYSMEKNLLILSIWLVVSMVLAVKFWRWD